MYLYGASGHAKVIIEILEKSGIVIKGLFDDNKNIIQLFNYKCIDYNPNEHYNELLIVSIGDNFTRKIIVDRISHINYGKAIDKTSSVSKRSIISVGTVVMPGAIVNSDTHIGKHCIINTNASVDHDCFLEDYVHISPGSSLSGGVIVGEGTHIGTGSSVIPNIRIGKWCIIGSGCVVIRDIPDYSVVVGNPGKIIKSKKMQ